MTFSSLKQKIILTHSVVLSKKLCDQENHIGLQPHSFKSLVEWLYTYPAFMQENQESKVLTQEEQELLGLVISEKLPVANYFKKAFQLKGVRTKVFELIQELRVAGYKAIDLKKATIDNKDKLESLTIIFALYEDYLKQNAIVDYAIILSSVLKRLQKSLYNKLLNQIELIVPFEMDFVGQEMSVFEFLSEKVQIKKQASDAIYWQETDKSSACLNQFKLYLKNILLNEPTPGPQQEIPLTPDLKLKVYISIDESIAEIFAWLWQQKADLGRTAIVTPNYDQYATAIYLFCQRFDIPLNLSQGIAATDLSFFGKFMADLDDWQLDSKKRGMPQTLAQRVRLEVQALQLNFAGFGEFKSKVIGFLNNYDAAKGKFAELKLPDAHFYKQLQEFLLHLKVSLSGLELESGGLYFGTPEDLIGVRADHLAVIGLEDHAYPPKVTPNPIINDSERMQLNELVEHEKDIELLQLSSLPEKKKNLLEKICLGIKKGLFLGFQSHDLQDGSLKVPSPFLNRLLPCFGYEIKIELIFKLAGLRSDITPNASNIFFNNDWLLATADQSGEMLKRYSNGRKLLQDTNCNVEDGVKLASQVLDNKKWSASSISQFFECPYRFYLKEVMKIAELEESENQDLQWLDPMDFGTYVHGVFEYLVNESKKLTPSLANWISYLEQGAVNDIKPAMLASEKELNSPNLLAPVQVIEDVRNEIAKIAQQFIGQEIARAKETEFYPIEAEFKFQDLEILLPNQKKLIFGGYIDRIDTNGKGQYLVLDYKTGKDKFKDTTNLFIDSADFVHFQHALYTLALVQYPKFDGKTEEVQAGYYYSTDKGGWQLNIGIGKEFLPVMYNAFEIFQKALTDGEFLKNPKSCKYCKYRMTCAGLPNQRKNFRTENLGQVQRISEVINGVEHE